MTTKTWNGTSGNFTDAANWSPAGTPTSGDVAVINAGTVAVSGTIAGIEIDLNEAANATGRTALALNGGRPIRSESSAPVFTIGAQAALLGLWTLTAWAGAALSGSVH